MRKFLLTAALVLAAIPAFAANISTTVTQTGQLPVTVAADIADADVTRIVAAYQDPANKQLAIDNPIVQPPPPAPPIPPAVATREQVLSYWIKSMLDYSNGQIINYERAKQQATLPPVVPIEPLTLKTTPAAAPAAPAVPVAPRPAPAGRSR
jgi:hypothetical protein